jgi:hypothetical protein
MLMYKYRFLMKWKEIGWNITCVQGKILRGQNMNAISWAFYCVNDDKEIDLGNLQVMRCLFCYDCHVHALNPNIKERND